MGAGAFSHDEIPERGTGEEEVGPIVNLWHFMVVKGQGTELVSSETMCQMRRKEA
jgi:hypothetical protein